MHVDSVEMLNAQQQRHDESNGHISVAFSCVSSHLKKNKSLCFYL